MATLYILLALSPLLLIAIWLMTSHLTASAIPIPQTLRNKRIILLIAHPDDEAMFFAPTLLALTSPDLGNHLKILCLSTGNADGLGTTRSKELIESALTLGVRKREDVFVMDDPRFKDGMKEDWKKEDVCRVLGMAFAPQIVSNNSSTPSPSPPPPSDREKDRDRDKSSSTRRKSSKHTTTPTTPTVPSKPTTSPSQQSQQPRATIDVLITFDRHGISSHPNHRALHAGAHLFLASIMRGHAGWKCPVTLYTLPTVNVLRKYAFVLDALTTMLMGVVGAITAHEKKGEQSKSSRRVLFVNDVGKYWRAREAMVKGHKSQMVWFRWGWISVGRYMVVNDLRREGV